MFLAALLLRGLTLFQVAQDPEVALQPDSHMYVSLAQGVRQEGCFCYPGRADRPDAERMPGYPALLALAQGLFGERLLPVLCMQVLLDCLSCILIYGLAERVWRGAGLLSGLLAAANMGMITYAHFILNDSLFLFLFLVVLIGMYGFLAEGQWRTAVMLGAGMGLVVYVRPVLLYFPLFIIPFYVLYLRVRLKASLLVALGKGCALGLAFALVLTPWAMRNALHYGRFKLTAQSGEHLLQYVVPFVWQYSRGIPFIEGMKGTNRIFRERAEAEGHSPKGMGPFEKSELQVRIAMDLLKREPVTALGKAWLFGMAKNLFAPAVMDFSSLLRVERPHFFYTAGRTLIERGWNLIRGMKGIFGWAVIGSLLGLVLVRTLQLHGLVLLIRRGMWEGLLAGLVILYFLLVSGPVGYAKYRLPMEPLLIILLAVGIRDLYGRIRPRTPGQVEGSGQSSWTT